MSLRFWLFVRDDLHFAMRGGSAGGKGSSVSSIGVGSTHSSSSRSAESDDIVREKSTSTAVAFRVLQGMVGASLGVTGPTGSSSVQAPLCPLSEAAREERWSALITGPSPASKKSSEKYFLRLRASLRPRRQDPIAMNLYRRAVVFVLLGIGHRFETVIGV
ncbi:hypothetical protein EI94DRAFT_1798653 [Lactarius quietus]|nr:hypothetical protein EI94DRAFT_1798653 [Lactarius quietus]